MEHDFGRKRVYILKVLITTIWDVVKKIKYALITYTLSISAPVFRVSLPKVKQEYFFKYV